MMKNKNVLTLTIFSLIACALHAIMLHTPFNDYVYTSAFKVIVFILCPIIYFRVSGNGNFKDLISLFKMKDKGNLKFSFILGFGVFAFIVAVFMILQPLFDSAMVVDTLAEYGITPGNAVFVFVYIVVINAALEQFFFRGFVFMSLYRMNFKRYAHAFSSLLFAVYHIPIFTMLLHLPCSFFVRWALSLPDSFSTP